MGTKLSATAVSTAVLALAACMSSTPTGHGGEISPGRATDWPAYHADAARSGVARGLPEAGRLAVGWSVRLSGAVYGQPIVVGNLVFAATERDVVYGLDRRTGRIRWQRHVARPLPLADQPCGNIDPLGITSTMVYYRGLVYAVAQAGRVRHVLVGMDPQTGQVRYRRLVPSPDGQPLYDQQRSALAAGNGRIYVAFGGHFGDCGPYSGSVVGVPAAGAGALSRPMVAYLVRAPRAGIWAPGGPVIGRNGTVYVGVGNGGTSPPYDGSDSVMALSPRLRRTGVFAPSTWIADNRGDLDLGSMTPALAGTRILIVGKRGVGYLLDAMHLGGIGGQLAQRPVCPAFGSATVIGQTVIVPCAGGGPAAVSISNGEIRVLWRGPASADGSPVAGGGAVWVADTAGGVLYELDPRTGAVRQQISLGAELPHFASPSLSGRLVLVGTMRGVVAVTGA